MTLIVKTVTHLTVGLVFIYGIYIALRGHISPGGSFAGGVIIALSFIQLILAFGKEAVLRKMSENSILALAGISAIIFLFISTLRGSITLLDLAGALMVGASLLLIFLALVLLNGEIKEK